MQDLDHISLNNAPQREITMQFRTTTKTAQQLASHVCLILKRKALTESLHLTLYKFCKE